MFWKYGIATVGGWRDSGIAVVSLRQEVSSEVAGRGLGIELQ